jgi:hypothetical protein
MMMEKKSVLIYLTGLIINTDRQKWPFHYQERKINKDIGWNTLDKCFSKNLFESPEMIISTWVLLFRKSKYPDFYLSEIYLT